VLDHRTWRTGEIERDLGWAARARDIRSVTAWCSFENRDATRWLWFQVTPLASASDASQALAGCLDRGVRNARADVHVDATQELSGLLVRSADEVLARQQETSGPRGLGTAVYVAARMDQTIAVVAFSGARDSWPPEEIAAIAENHCARVAHAT
jgi:hypothetical protein